MNATALLGVQSGTAVIPIGGTTTTSSLSPQVNLNNTFLMFSAAPVTVNAPENTLVAGQITSSGFQVSFSTSAAQTAPLT
ncbi:MAG TPA: hypothetical protein VK859_11395, partial [bacterium]|nr:hypothetical protein [bacterium]